MRKERMAAWVMAAALCLSLCALPAGAAEAADLETTAYFSVSAMRSCLRPWAETHSPIVLTTFSFGKRTCRPL